MDCEKRRQRLAVFALAVATCLAVVWLAARDYMPSWTIIVVKWCEFTGISSSPPQPEAKSPGPFNFFSYKVILKSGREILARDTKREGNLVKVTTDTGLYIEIPWQDVNYILKTNKR
jgi:hypothetical protein